MSQAQFTAGDRVFSHYVMAWGTIRRVEKTVTGQRHGVTGDPLPDSTWYTVDFDNGHVHSLDDAHGDWSMARIMPPSVAVSNGYGSDPNDTR
jgi:hypothetical protein